MLPPIPAFNPDNPDLDAIRIIGIDPGSTNLGYARLDFSGLTGKIIRTNAITLTVGRKSDMDVDMAETHGDRFARIAALCDQLKAMLESDRPHYIVCESPFYNPKRPMAYGVLVEVMSALRRTVWEYHPFMKFDPIDPSSAKNAVGASGAAKKEVMQQAIISMTELNYEGEIPQTEIDEHSIDAIAVAYSRYKKLLSYFANPILPSRS